MKKWDIEKAGEQLERIEEAAVFLELAEVARQEGSPLEDRYIAGISVEKGDFSGLEVSGSVFENCVFSDSVFPKSYFKDCLFKSCDFSNCNFSSSTFSRCSFEQVKAIGADFSESVFKQAELRSCLFRYAVFTLCLLQDIAVEDCDLSEAWLDSCKGQKWRWKDVSLVRANLYKTPLKGVDLRACQIEGIILSTEAREISGAVVDWMQAAELARFLGVVIK